MPSLHQVTCGSLVKLVHVRSGYKLHSHDIAYGSGSGQQSVTGFEGQDDANSYWVVRGTEVSILPLTASSPSLCSCWLWPLTIAPPMDQDKPCPQGTPLKKGDRVRLQHHSSRKWLHSHNFRSPLTQNLEVSMQYRTFWSSAGMAG